MWSVGISENEHGWHIKAVNNAQMLACQSAPDLEQLYLGFKHDKESTHQPEKNCQYTIKETMKMTTFPNLSSSIRPSRIAI